MLDHFKTLLPLSPQQWDDYTRCFHRHEVPPKTTLLNEGEIPQKVFLIEKGCLRAWFSHEGKDITFQFFFEHNAVASIESLKKGFPSPVSIEAIEPSIVWYIHKKDAARIVAEISEVRDTRNIFIDAVLERSFDYMKHAFSFIRDTPQQRYAALIAGRPEIIRRVPQHYIASYLGISTVHLSRIKSRLARESR